MQSEPHFAEVIIFNSIQVHSPEAFTLIALICLGHIILIYLLQFDPAILAR